MNNEYSKVSSLEHEELKESITFKDETVSNTNFKKILQHVE
jgi:hypothetical protein